MVSESSSTESRLRVLVVDDDPTIREALSARLEAWGYEPETAASVADARRALERTPPDLVLADLVLPEAGRLELLETVESHGRGQPVILITAHGSIDLAVEAMKRGARDFLTKPLDADKLRAVLEEADEELRLREKIRELDARLDEDGGLGPLVGSSEAMQEVYELVRLLGEKDTSAILTGESGTGKEVVARTIHQLSARRGEPFVAVNAAAIPEGLIESELFGHEEGAFTGATRTRPGRFEQADGGTLLVDELAEMPVELQPKMLRILETGAARRVGGSEEREFDVRVLAATNRDVDEAIEAGSLREDLYFRLSVFEVHVPPLREHLEDIPLLAQHFIRSFNQKHDTAVEGLREAAASLLAGYEWPGNVRELRNVIERATIMAERGLVGPSHLPPYLREGPDESRPQVVVPVGTPAREAEKRLILETLRHVNDNKAEAARQLGLDPKTIRNKLKRYRERSGGGRDGDDRGDPDREARAETGEEGA